MSNTLPPNQPEQEATDMNNAPTGRVLPSLNRLILLLVIAPLLTVSISLTVYFISSLVNEFTKLFDRSGSTFAEQIAKSAELGVYAADTQALNAASHALLEDPYILNITFFDNQRTLLASFGDILDFPEARLTRKLEMGSTSDYLVYTAPIKNTHVAPDDFVLDEDSVAHTNEPPLGWVRIVIDKRDIIQVRQKFLLAGLLVCLIAAGIAIIIKLLLNRTLISPIEQLDNTVDRIKRGDFRVRPPIMTTRELNTLADGVSLMASRLEHWNEDLQARIHTATQSLQVTLNDLHSRNAELEQTRDQLIEANQARDNFLARMSHELRTPLTSIIGYNKLQKPTLDDPSQQEYNRVIHESAYFLLTIIEDLLTFNKIQFGSVQLEKQPFDIERCLKDVIAMHMPQAYEKQLEFIVDIAPDVPVCVIGDPLKFKQIINNLVSNAIKFTPSGQVYVALKSDGNSDRDIQLTLSVIDTGIGIQEADTQTLFREFAQADTSISRRFGGTGLGLPIAQSLAAMMSGNIKLNRIPDGGTEAVCQLTFGLDQRESETPLTAVKQLSHVIIFEDNAACGQALKNMINGRCQRVDIVDHTSKLFSLLQNNEPTLILSGVSKQHIDDNLVMPAILEARAISTAPILLAGGLSEAPAGLDADQVQQAAPIVQISKPVFPSELNARINELLAENTIENADASAQTTPQLLANLHILVAEDNTFNRDLIAQLLEQAGATVHQAGDGNEAITQFKQHAIDVALLDLNMPIMDGYEAARALTETASRSLQSIIALTATTVSIARENPQAHYFNAFVQKPLDESQLIRVIARQTQRISEDATEPGNRQPMTPAFSNQQLAEEINRLADNIKQDHLTDNPSGIKYHAHQMRSLTVFGPQFESLAAIAKWLDEYAESAETDILDAQVDALASCLESIDFDTRDSGP